MNSSSSEHARRWLLVAAIGGIVFALILATAMSLSRESTASIVGLVQLICIGLWHICLRTPGRWAVTLTALAVMIGSDLAAVYSMQALLMVPSLCLALGMPVAAGAQLARRAQRYKAVESLVSTAVIMVIVVSLSIAIVVQRYPAGARIALISWCVAGLSLAVAKVADFVFPRLQLSPHNSRGALGIIAGSMVGAGASAIIGSPFEALPVTSLALLGWFVALSTIMVDVAAGHIDWSRKSPRISETVYNSLLALSGPLLAVSITPIAAYVYVVAFIAH